jgi:hypothetical protein
MVFVVWEWADLRRAKKYRPLDNASVDVDGVQFGWFVKCGCGVEDGCSCSFEVEQQWVLLGVSSRPKMKAVERCCEGPCFHFLCASSDHQMRELELQKKGITGECDVNVVATSGSSLINE